LTIKATIML